jgi:opacity protein-like surface antigen
MGLGWTMAKANTRSSMTMGAGYGDASYSGKPTARDNAPIGKIFVGHSFKQGNINWLTEAMVGLDASKVKGKSTSTADLIGGAGGATSNTLTTTLRRQGFLGLSGGISGNVAKDLSLYGKVSLLLAQFKMSASSSFSPQDAAATALLVAANPGASFSTKTKTKWGIGATLGVSKPVSENMSFGVDYSFETFQKISLKNRKGAVYSYSGHMKPTYHTVMLNLSTKI